ncbi:UNVERIFIED_CONTAM: hypothetical protein PYX00_000350 [Menopon gallinae]|uniref:Uncharacterized protein n=1 Tax=Menopon gallinae TaxID=328185 RepID=A0AAW2I9K7_9NEOP
MRFVIFLAVLEVISLSSARSLTPRTASSSVTPLKPSNEIPKSTDSQYTRKRRCLGTIIQLLWPQVVGPVDEGIIKERTYDEIPKTLLEHRLDRIRKKAKEEEMSRLAVRAYMQERLARINQVNHVTNPPENLYLIGPDENRYLPCYYEG